MIDLMDLAEYLAHEGVKGPVVMAGQHGVENSEYRGMNYITVYFGSDFETPTRAITKHELEFLNRALDLVHSSPE